MTHLQFPNVDVLVVVCCYDHLIKITFNLEGCYLRNSFWSVTLLLKNTDFTSIECCNSLKVHVGSIYSSKNIWQREGPSSHNHQFFKWNLLKILWRAHLKAEPVLRSHRSAVLSLLPDKASGCLGCDQDQDCYQEDYYHSYRNTSVVSGVKQFYIPNQNRRKEIAGGSQSQESPEANCSDAVLVSLQGFYLKKW